MSSKDEKRQLLIEIAKMYYIDGVMQSEIAARLGISHASVSRIIHKALEDGIVTITVQDTMTKRPEIANRIRKMFGLTDVYISESSHDVEMTRRNAGMLAAEVIKNWLDHNLAMGVSNGILDYYVSRNIQNPNNVMIDVVQMMGNGYDYIINSEGSRLISIFNNKLMGTGHILNAPLMVGNRQARDTLMREKTIMKTTSLYSSLDIALFEIDIVRSHLSYQLSEPWLSKADTLQLDETRAIGSMAGLYFDANGNCCSVGMNDRRIGIEIENIREVKNTIGMAVGRGMAEATKAVLNSGLIKYLIIDEMLAVALDKGEST